MITLYGTTISNYYNKVKLALLEKGIPFEEVLVKTGSTDEAVLGASPLAKVPFIRDDGRPLCESQVIVDYLEARYPQHPLLPADAFEAAKVRELATFVDLHIELVARELYGAFAGRPPGDETKARVLKQLTKNIAAFRRLAKFSPYVAGDSFTLADCSAWGSLPVVVLATKAAYGEDLLLQGGIDVKAYRAVIEARPTTAKIIADRKAEQAVSPRP